MVSGDEDEDGMLSPPSKARQASLTSLPGTGGLGAGLGAPGGGAGGMTADDLDQIYSSTPYKSSTHVQRSVSLKIDSRPGGGHQLGGRGVPRDIRGINGNNFELAHLLARADSLDAKLMMELQREDRYLIEHRDNALPDWPSVGRGVGIGQGGVTGGGRMEGSLPLQTVNNNLRDDGNTISGETTVTGLTDTNNNPRLTPKRIENGEESSVTGASTVETLRDKDTSDGGVGVVGRSGLGVGGGVAVRSGGGGVGGGGGGGGGGMGSGTGGGTSLDRVTLPLRYRQALLQRRRSGRFSHQQPTSSSSSTLSVGGSISSVHAGLGSVREAPDDHLGSEPGGMEDDVIMMYPPGLGGGTAAAEAQPLQERQRDAKCAILWTHQEIRGLKQQNRQLLRQLLDLGAAIHKLSGMDSAQSVCDNLGGAVDQFDSLGLGGVNDGGSSAYDSSLLDSVTTSMVTITTTSQTPKRQQPRYSFNSIDHFYRHD